MHPRRSLRINKSQPRFCMMREMKECFDIAYQIPRASTHRATIDRTVQWVREAGSFALYMSWSQLYILGMDSDMRLERDGAQKTITWTAMGDIFWAYGVGMFAGVLAFALEPVIAVAMRIVGRTSEDVD